MDPSSDPTKRTEPKIVGDPWTQCAAWNVHNWLPDELIATSLSSEFPM